MQRQEQNEPGFPSEKYYFNYKFAKSVRDQRKWTGLDVYITVDKDWDKLLPKSLGFEEKQLLLEKLLGLICKNQKTTHLYLSRITREADGSCKAWFFAEELSPQNTEPHEFNALVVTAEALRKAKLEESLKPTKASPYPLIHSEDLDIDDEDELDGKIPVAALFSGIEADEEDPLTTLLVEFLSRQVDRLIAAEMLEAGGANRDRFKLPALKSTIVQALSEQLQELKAVQKDLNLFLLETPPTPDKVTKREEAQTSLQEVEKYIDSINGYLADALKQEERRKKQIEEEQAVRYATYTLPVEGSLIKMITIRVDEAWDQALPIEMPEEEKAAVLNKILQHLCSKEYRASLPEEASPRVYHTLYLSKVLLAGNQYKGWFANTSWPYYQKYSPLAFEIAASTLDNRQRSDRLREIEDQSYQQSDANWAGYERHRDNRLREAMNQEVYALLQREYDYLAPVKIHVNPAWGATLTYLTASKKEDLLDKILYFVSLENERLPKNGGRATALYISQITREGDAYTAWLADLSSPDHTLRAIVVKQSQLPAILNPNRGKGQFSRAPSRAGEEKEDQQVFEDLDAQLQVLIKHELEELAEKKLEVDFFNALLEPLIDRRNQLTRLERVFNAERVKVEGLKDDEEETKEVAEEPQAFKEFEKLRRATLQDFNEDPAVKMLKAEMETLKAEFRRSLTAEFQLIESREQKLKDISAQKYASVRQDLILNKNLFAMELAIPLAQTMQEFIPGFLKATKKLKKEKRSAALLQFSAQCAGLIALAHDLNFDELTETKTHELAQSLSHEIQKNPDRERLLEMINHILEKASILDSERDNFANRLKANLLRLEQRGAFKLAKSLGSAQLIADIPKMEALLTKERSVDLRKDIKAIAAEITKPTPEDQVIQAKLDSYQQKVTELERIFESKKAALLEKRQAQERQTLTSLDEANIDMAPGFKEINQRLAPYIQYLKDYFEVDAQGKPHKHQRTASNFLKVDAGLGLLADLERIDKRAAELRQIKISTLPLNQQLDLLREKSEVIIQINQAFSKAQQLLVTNADNSNKSALVKRGFWAQFKDKVSSKEKLSPKKIINEFLNPATGSGGIHYFVSLQFEIRTALDTALDKIRQEKQKDSGTGSPGPRLPGSAH